MTIVHGIFQILTKICILTYFHIIIKANVTLVLPRVGNLLKTNALIIF